MIIEMSSKPEKASSYLKQFAQLSTRRLERFGVPINRVQIRLEDEGEGLYKDEKRCLISISGQNDFHVNVKHKGKTFRQAMLASFHRVELALRRQHAKRRQVRSRLRISEMPVLEPAA